QLDELAENEEDIHVRQQLACTAARLAPSIAMPIINANINRSIDLQDPYMPLLWWWAVERHCIEGSQEVLKRFVRPTLWNSQLGRDKLLGLLIRRYAAESSSADRMTLAQSSLVDVAPKPHPLVL
ncbi:MAG: L-sorbosone dehydrogenase, partial [Pirellula sp.]